MTTVANALTGISQPLPVPRILVIDKDKVTQATLQQIFAPEGYGVAIAESAEEGQALLRNAPPSVLMLGVQIENSSPRRFVEEVRFANPYLPIIVLGGSSSVVERVLFLELGADDYIVKPFHERELLARVRAAMRRPQGRSMEVFTFDDVRVNFRRMEVRRQGAPVPLTAQEFKVLKFMIHNAERVISREELLNEAWGYRNYPTTRTVDNHILKLRQKLEREPSEPVHFLTIHCVGYKFVPNSDDPIEAIRRSRTQIRS